MQAVVIKSSTAMKRNGFLPVDPFLMEGKSMLVKNLHTQVGGHIGFLKLSEYVLKPVQAAMKGVREKKFYENVELPLAQFIPEYYGIVELKLHENEDTKEYIVLEDIAKGFVCPTIADIKIGKRTYGPDASPDKIDAENSKYSGTKVPFGLSFVSMFVYPISLDDKVPQIYDRNFGKKLKTEEIYQIPIIFFDLKSGFRVKPLIRCVIEKIKKIKEIFETQVSYNLYSSSLLIVYDTHIVRAWIKNPDTTDISSSVRVKIIDFAHAHESNGKMDTNFLFGLNNLITLFEKMLND
ncbi:inositol polyphosphate multikinase [Lepeophtheirus salmonis]|uniref:inositol polyphosphate multikinase n=1 Tax=Lepeophtheirus salmonis TaxID=72036 RepID=UPI001AE9362B|nr:inositol polyphosphate multikinase-like [Lepeophtheirus salmonis]